MTAPLLYPGTNKAPRVYPFAQVWVDGELLGTTLAEAQAFPPRVAVLDDLTVSWGRQSMLDHHASQQATVGLMDVYGSWVFRDLVGAVVTMNYYEPASGQSRTFFRGRVAEHVIQPQRAYGAGRLKGRWRGPFHRLSCTGQVTELGNRTTGIESWPDESATARMGRLQALVVPSVLAGIQWGTFGSNGPLAARKVDNTDALSLIHSLADSLQGQRMAYDPQTNILTAQPRRWVAVAAGVDKYLQYRTDTGDTGVGVYAAGPANEGGVSLDGAEWDDGGAGLGRSIQSRLTRVDYTWQESAARAGGVILDSASEASKGRRGMNLTTEYRQGDWALQAASTWWDILANEGRKFQPPALTYGPSDGGFQGLQTMRLVIGGAEMLPGEPGRFVTLNNTQWPRLGQSTVYGVIGGVIRHVGGAWRPTIYLQPCGMVGGGNTRMVGGGLRAGGDAPFRWEQWSHAVTWNDLRYL